jgi:hypothetical protein
MRSRSTPSSWNLDYTPEGWASQAGGLPALAKKVKDLQGQNNWAVVEGDTGDIVRQFSSAGPITGSHIVGTGLYAVTFSKDVSGCSFMATLGSVGTNFPTIGMIGVTSDSGDPNSIVVQTADKTGTLADASFHLYQNRPERREAEHVAHLPAC